MLTESSTEPEVPGWYKKRKLAKQKMQLEERRTEVLSRIAWRLFDVEQMAQRPRSANDAINSTLLKKVQQGLTEIAGSVQQAEHTDKLDDLADDADRQATFSAYLCPREEIKIEGHLAFELMEWWGVPKSETNRLRELLVDKLDSADENPEGARSALHALFKERDDWEEYRDDYEDAMRSRAGWLFWSTLALPLTAIISFYLSFRFASLLFAPLRVVGILFAGVAGSCVSVVSKLPALDVCRSEKIDSYDRLIWSRLSVGTSASLIGCGLLGWGLIPISIQGRAFAEALDASSTSVSTFGAALRMLILLAVPLLFGFSERALTSFERSFFGKPAKSQKE
ncbi:MAG: hypothetical protein CXZ00_07805 [Acidobacteria bacterium]|nr:MAG: hypothetical protein CXZ00_07805 [Acidobacteriota bacterium]